MKISDTNTLNHNEQIVYSTLIDNSSFHTRHSKEEYIICTKNEYEDIKKFIIKYSIALSGNPTKLGQCRQLMKVSPFLLYVIIKTRIEKSKPIELENNMTYYDLCKTYALDNGALNESKQYDNLNIKVAVSQATGQQMSDDFLTNQSSNDDSDNVSSDDTLTQPSQMSDYAKELLQGLDDTSDIENAKVQSEINTDQFTVNNPLETVDRDTGIEMDYLNDMDVIKDIAIQEEKSKEKKQTSDDFVIQKPLADMTNKEIKPELDTNGNIKLNSIEYKGDETQPKGTKYRIVDAPIKPINKPSESDIDLKDNNSSVDNIVVNSSTNEFVEDNLTEQDRQNLHNDLKSITDMSNMSDLSLDDIPNNANNMFGTFPMVEKSSTQSSVSQGDTQDLELDQQPSSPIIDVPKADVEELDSNGIKPYNAIDIYKEDLSNINIENTSIEDNLNTENFNDMASIVDKATRFAEQMSDTDNSQLEDNTQANSPNNEDNIVSPNQTIETEDNLVEKIPNITPTTVEVSKVKNNHELDTSNKVAKEILPTDNHSIDIKYLSTLLSHKEELFTYLLNKATKEDIEQFIHELK